MVATRNARTIVDLTMALSPTLEAKTITALATRLSLRFLAPVVVRNKPFGLGNGRKM